MKRKLPFLVEPHTKVRLSRLSTSEHTDVEDKGVAETIVESMTKKLAALQEVLYASQSKALLIVLQGMDTAGKDGTVRHIFSGINPAGCQVASFKVPTALEARHDFLWRCHAQVPPAGMMGIFNRSHYEDVLWPRVHGSMDRKTMEHHLDDINHWESMLVDNGVVILKFFLHISRDEQTARLQSRIDEADKHWKLSPADFEERKFWPQYMDCYEDILAHTSHRHAPWFVIPADHKWYRDVAISEVLVDTLTDLNLKYPKPTFDPTGLKLDKESLGSAEKKVHKRKNKKAKAADAESIVHGSTTS